jgi:hypothetical protein
MIRLRLTDSIDFRVKCQCLFFGKSQLIARLLWLILRLLELLIRTRSSIRLTNWLFNKLVFWYLKCFLEVKWGLKYYYLDTRKLEYIFMKVNSQIVQRILAKNIWNRYILCYDCRRLLGFLWFTLISGESKNG